MTLLDNDLDRISQCAHTYAAFPFARPGIFTNALLQQIDITTLIRDTESHERALFSVPPAPPPKTQDRRSTLFNPTPNASSTVTSGAGANAMRAPKRNTAVAAVLGTELVDRIRKGGGGGAGTGLGYRKYDATSRKEVDVDTLLEGAEKLLSVYPIPGAQERIVAMRQRHHRLEASVEYYESRIARQTEQLSRLSRTREYQDEPDDVEPDEEPALTEEDLRREEEEVRALEQKKRGLEDRVHSMGRDISGLRHQA